MWYVKCDIAFQQTVDGIVFSSESDTFWSFRLEQWKERKLGWLLLLLRIMCALVIIFIRLLLLKSSSIDVASPIQTFWLKIPFPIRLEEWPLVWILRGVKGYCKSFLILFNKFVILGLILMQNLMPNTFALKGWHSQIPLSD